MWIDLLTLLWPTALAGQSNLDSTEMDNILIGGQEWAAHGEDYGNVSIILHLLKLVGQHVSNRNLKRWQRKRKLPKCFKNREQDYNIKSRN